MERSPKPCSTKRRGAAASPHEERAKRARAVSESAPLPRANSQPPAAKATNFAIGTVREGGDGTKWRVVVGASGTAWKLVVGDVSGGQSTQAKVAAAAPAASGGEAGDAAAGDAEREGKRSHPFAVGDAVEAVFKEGSWALATVRSTRAKQVEVEYVREQEEEPQETGPSGTRYLAKENETVRGIAGRFGLAVAALMHLNSHVDGLTPSAKLRELTALLLPEAHVARENDTARGVAQQHGRELEELLALNRHALPDVQPSGKLKAGTIVLLPRAVAEGAAGAAEAAAAAKRKKKLKVLPQLGERIEVEVADEDGDGATVWKPAEVRGLLSGGRFSACVAEDEDFIEEYSLQEEHSEWRRLQAKPPVARLRGVLPAVGDVIEVEVEDEGRTRWRRAEVRRVRPAAGEGGEGGGEGGEGGGGGGARFSVVVDGDEDFQEEYGQAEEGKEWRHVARGAGGRRVHEWTSLSLVRPVPPVPPSGYLEAARVDSAVQALQDGLWWRATVQGLACADGLPFVAEVPEEGEAEEVAPTLVVQLLARPHAPPLRVRRSALRPDWEYAPSSGWRLWAPQPAPRAAPAAAGCPAAPRLMSAAGGGGGGGGAEGTARWSAYARGGTPASAPAWARGGMEVEARLGETWLGGAWWAAQLLEAAPRGALLLFHHMAASDGAEERWQEWAAWGQVRPLPPSHSADFLAATREGEAVEVWWEDAWWRGALLAPPRRGLASVRLEALKHRQLRSVETRCLRPGWQWGSAGWSAPCIAPAPPASLDLNAAPAPAEVASPGSAAPHGGGGGGDEESDDEAEVIRLAQARAKAKAGLPAAPQCAAAT